jgi:hypothetical protein
VARLVIRANPREPDTGQFAWKFYDDTHLVTGRPDTVPRLQQALAKFEGHEIVVTFQGIARDIRNLGPGAPEIGWERSAVIFYEDYFDLLGSTNSLFYSVLKDISSKDSELYGYEIVITYVIIEDI